MTTARRALILLPATALLLLAVVTRSEAVPWFRRALTQFEEEELQELASQLRSPANSPVQKAVVAGRMARLRHEKTLPHLSDLLRSSRDEVPRMEAAAAMGRVGSPLAVLPLLEVYRDRTATAQLRMTAIHALADVSESVAGFGESSVGYEFRNYAPAIKQVARDYFQQLERGLLELADVADVWAATIHQAGLDEQVEQSALAALSSPASTEQLKIRLARLVSATGVLDKTKAERALIGEYPRTRNTRYRVALIEALAKVPAGKKLILNVAATGEDAILRRSAIRGLAPFAEETTIKELAGMLSESDSLALVLLSDLFKAKLTTLTLPEYCETALKLRDSRQTANACAVLRSAVESWRIGNHGDLWLSAFENATQHLLRIMESDLLSEPARREAYLALWAILPDDRRPSEAYDPSASTEKRRTATADLRALVDSPEGSDGIRKAIELDTRPDEKPEENGHQDSSGNPSATRSEAPEATASPERSLPPTPAASPTPRPSATPTLPRVSPTPAPSGSPRPLPSQDPRTPPPPSRTAPPPSFSRGPLPPTIAPRPSSTPERTPKRSPSQTPEPTPEPHPSWHPH